MEVNGGARKHPHPQDYDKIQCHIQQIENHPGQSRQAGRLQGSHGCGLLQDEESRVGQDEGVSRNVVADPVETSPPAAGFGGELLNNIHGVSLKT